MSDFDEMWIRIEEFAHLAGLRKGSLYQYASRGAHGMPKPAKIIGTVKFFRRTAVLAWIAERERQRVEREYDFG